MLSLVTYSKFLVMYYQPMLHGFTIKVFLCLVLLNTVLLHYKYNNYTWYIYSAWFLDNSISTCHLEWLCVTLFALKHAVVPLHRKTIKHLCGNRMKFALFLPAGPALSNFYDTNCQGSSSWLLFLYYYISIKRAISYICVTLKLKKKEHKQLNGAP